MLRVGREPERFLHRKCSAPALPPDGGLRRACSAGRHPHVPSRPTAPSSGPCGIAGRIASTSRCILVTHQASRFLAHPWGQQREVFPWGSSLAVATDLVRSTPLLSAICGCVCDGVEIDTGYSQSLIWLGGRNAGSASEVV